MDCKLEQICREERGEGRGGAIRRCEEEISNKKDVERRRRESWRRKGGGRGEMAAGEVEVCEETMIEQK